jgi:hypothetical protein
LAHSELLDAVLRELRDVDPGRLQRIGGETELAEEAADRRGVLVGAGLRGGEILGLGRIGNRPDGKVGGDVALGEAADGD